MEILWKGTVSTKFRATVSTKFWANRSKLCGNFALPQNFQTRKLGEITVFYAVIFPVFLNRVNTRLEHLPPYLIPQVNRMIGNSTKRFRSISVNWMVLISFYVAKKIAKPMLRWNWHSLTTVADKLYETK